MHAAFQRQIPAMIVFEGWAAAGKGGTINVLTERLDPRGVRVVPISPPRSSEMRYPWMWRYWQQIPAYGQTVIYDTSWYRRVLTDRVAKTVKKSAWKEAYQDIVEYESMLGAEGTLIRSSGSDQQKEQGRRFKRLLASKLTSWQVAGEDAAQHKRYEKYAAAVEEMLARTDSPTPPGSSSRPPTATTPGSKSSRRSCALSRIALPRTCLRCGRRPAWASSPSPLRSPPSRAVAAPNRSSPSAR